MQPASREVEWIEMKTKTLAKFYADDHHRLDGLFATFQDLKGKDPKRAKESFQAFRSGLEQHMAWEPVGRDRSIPEDRWTLDGPGTGRSLCKNEAGRLVNKTCRSAGFPFPNGAILNLETNASLGGDVWERQQKN